jgi:hypothetical protein
LPSPKATTPIPASEASTPVSLPDALTLAEQWDVTLEQILRDADVMTEKREFKP